jgi:hypothetical protein
VCGGRLSSAYINTIPAPEIWVGVPKHLEKARHGLQAGEASRVEAILHVGHSHDATH